MTGEISRNHPGLAEHADEIRLLGQRIVTDVVEIGRRLNEAKALAGHGRFGRWLSEEFGWSATTALNFMRVYELSRSNPQRVEDSKLPLRMLYQIAAPSTPKAAVTEILDRATAGEPVSGAEVKETIARVKRKGDTAEIAQVTPSDTTETAQVMPGGAPEVETAQVAPGSAAAAQVAPDSTAETVAQDGVLASADASNEADPPPELAPGPAPDPVATAAAAVNRLTVTELQDFLDRLWPAPQSAFRLKFGAHNSANTNAEIATLAGECSALLAHAEQNTNAIRKKLVHIQALTGNACATSNAKLDHGAFKRAMGTAGQPGEKFSTLTMTPNGVDETGNKNFALPRGNIHGIGSNRE